MKYAKYVLITLCSICLVSCYEVNEEITINEDGSGTYLAKMNMDQLIDMMQSFAGEEEMTKDGLDRPMDTIIPMALSPKMTPEERALVKNGYLRVQLNIKDKIFQTNADIPFTNLSNLQKLMSKQGGMSDMLKGFFGGNKSKDTVEPDAPSEPQLDDFSNIFTVTVNNGLISKKIDTLKYRELMANPQMADVKKMAGSGIEIPYTTTIRLPRPAKKTDNPLVTLSEDKKTATIRYDLLALLNDPGKFSWSVEY